MSESWKVTGGLACAAWLAFAAMQPVAAGAMREQVAADDRYHVYFDESDLRGANAASGYSITREWGALSLSGGGRDNGLIGYSGPSGVSYFTPRLSGLRVGVGVSAAPRGGPHPNAATRSEYTQLGPRIRSRRDPTGNWQIGGTLGYSALEIGANLGDHTDPTCAPGAPCKTNDFWDVGVALRIGAGAISAGYKASQLRAARVDNAGRIDVFSLNAGYRLAPGVDIFGGVDWIDLGAAGESEETPTDTRFMLGTSVRF